MVRNALVSSILGAVVVGAVINGRKADSSPSENDTLVSKNVPTQEAEKSLIKAVPTRATPTKSAPAKKIVLDPKAKNAKGPQCDAPCCLHGKPPVAKTALTAAAAAPEDKKAEATKKKAPAKKAKVYPKADPKMGHLVGRVVLKGAAPKLPAPTPSIPSNNKDAKFCTSAGNFRDERLVLGPKKGIRDVVVTLSEKKKFRKKPKPKQYVLDNDGCVFVPHIGAMSVGSTVKVTSSDTVMHNAQAVLALSFNSAVSKTKPYESTRAKKPGIAIVTCSFHTWMQSRIHVLPHEFFDVSSDDGTFKIMNIPPGSYQFEVRHETLAPYLLKKHVKKKFTIKKGQSTEVVIELEAP